MADLAKLTAANLARWNASRVNPALSSWISGIAEKLVSAKPRYQAVAETTGVPWAVIAVIHEREASQSWLANLAQGDPWDKVSIHVPKGRGPFDSWEAAAEDALMHCAPFAANWEDWSVAGALTLIETYNGLGYAARGMPSPYVWSCTNQYIRGKYIADGHFDPTAVDHQIGCAALLIYMKVIDPTIAGEWHP